MKIVGLVGPKRSGKDTAAAALVEQRGFVRVGFADQVKDLALRIDPFLGEAGNFNGWPLKDVVELHGWEFAKTLPEVRRLLQELGTGVRDIVGPESWVAAWDRHVNELSVWDIVVPDVRFVNEASALRAEKDCLLIRITRPGLDLSDTHVSETEQLGITCDAELVNDGTPEDLRTKVLAIYDEWVS